MLARHHVFAEVAVRSYKYLAVRTILRQPGTETQLFTKFTYRISHYFHDQPLYAVITFSSNNGPLPMAVPLSLRLCKMMILPLALMPLL
jgi:hypothetical protein